MSAAPPSGPLFGYGFAMRTRSMLFGPANRVDFVPKFVASGADIGVLDLEDAVAESGKTAARDAISQARPLSLIHI